MKKIYYTGLKLFSAAIILVSIISVIYIVYSSYNQDEIEMPCYDRYGSEIIGLTCLGQPEGIWSYLPIAFLSFFIGAVSYAYTLLIR